MIEFPRDSQDRIPTSSVKILGLGGAGANMLDRVALDGLEGAELLALNTDIRTLSGSVASERIQLGRNLTKGLGTGGDPELGHQAILEAEDEVRAALKGRKIVFICVGLGGGTGSGAAPIAARIARQEGAFVVMFATMPFVFEGARRREQAETALNELAVLSNALVTFDNSRMGELILAKQGVHEAFAAADRMISESIKAVIRLVVRPGLINIGLDDLMSALRTTRSRCLFGSGLARGKDRAQKALRNALASPLLDQGALLEDAQSVLVHLCGGEDLTLFEIELLMESLGKHVPQHAHVLFGAAVDASMEDQLSITLVSSLPEERLRSPAARDDARKREEEETALEPSIGFAASEDDEESEAPVSSPFDASGFEASPFAPAEAPPEGAGDEDADEASPAGFDPSEPEEPFSKGEEFDEDSRAEPEAKMFGVDSDESDQTSEDPEEAPFKIPADEIGPSEPGETPEPKPAASPAPEPKADLEPETKPEPANEPDFEKDDEPPFAESAFSVKRGKTKLPPVRKPKTGGLASSGEDPFAEGTEELFKKPSESGDPQGELSFDGGPKGRFEGDDSSMMDGEDLDVPAFLRKKKS